VRAASSFPPTTTGSATLAAAGAERSSGTRSTPQRYACSWPVHVASPDQLVPEADVPGPSEVLTEPPSEPPSEDGSAFGPEGGPDWQPASVATVRTHPTIPAASRRTV